MARFRLIRQTLREANAFVQRHHRHHGVTRGMIFAIGCAESDRLCGVAIVGRPVSRNVDRTKTAEITRMCSDGTEHACSFLYGAAFRASFALGFEAVITAILETEPGTSLRAAGYRMVRVSRGGTWSRIDRPRIDKSPTCPKHIYERRA